MRSRWRWLNLRIGSCLAGSGADEQRRMSSGAAWSEPPRNPDIAVARVNCLARTYGFQDTPRMVVFSPFTHEIINPNVDKYTIHGASGYHLWSCVFTILYHQELQCFEGSNMILWTKQIPISCSRTSIQISACKSCVKTCYFDPFWSLAPEFLPITVVGSRRWFHLAGCSQRWFSHNGYGWVQFYHVQRWYKNLRNGIDICLYLVHGWYMLVYVCIWSLLFRETTTHLTAWYYFTRKVLHLSH